MDKRPGEYEAQIQEQRLLEATQKNLMGPSGKIGVSLRMLGQPLIQQDEGGIYMDSYYLDDYYEEQEPLTSASTPIEFLKRLPLITDEDAERPKGKEWTDLPEPTWVSIFEVGYHFCGLSRGMHLELKYDNHTNRLTVHHKGYKVYEEVKGELLAYAPNDEWEGYVDRLYKVAKKKLREVKQQEFEEDVKQRERNKTRWWQAIRERWGL